MGYMDFPDYVPVRERRRRAEREARRLAKRGRKLSPVVVEGRSIAQTFWGRAWCENLEHYADFASRLPRGRSYVKNGSIIDLQITSGKLTALVMGTELYELEIDVHPLAKERWNKLVRDCSGRIDSLVELLSGKLSDGVMQLVTRPATGLFPAPREIESRCSCPDWARLCKHLAAALYAVGARLDQQPELLFLLRGVDPAELVERAACGTEIARAGKSARTTLDPSALGEIFGIEIDTTPRPVRRKSRKQKARR